jgi:DNA polymerase III sliding clamp (beta) subunit (PCNA family)
MEFSIETAALQQAVKVLSVVTRVNTTDPEGRILIQTNDDNTVSFITNNNSLALSIDTEKVTIKNQGAVSILYSKIKSFVGSFTAWNGEYGAKEFTLKESRNKLHIKVDNVFENGKNSSGNLHLEVYPTIMIQQPKPFGDATFILNSDIFKVAVGKVIYAIDPGEVRQNIQGMYVNFDKDNIYFTGTNGLMLSEYAVKNVSDIKEGGYIFKYDFIMALRRMLVDETQVFFEVEDRVVRAKFDSVCLSGRLVIGQEYPEYKSLFDKYEYSVIINRDVFINSLIPFMDVLNNDDNNRLTFSIINSRLSLKNDYADFLYNEDVPFDEVPSFIIDINGLFMKQTVEAIKDDDLLIKFSDEAGCLIFDSGNFQDQKALITPIKQRAHNE